MGENSDERAGDDAGSGAGAGEERKLDGGGGGRANAGELPAGQAALAALPETGGKWTGTSQRGAKFESSQAEEGAREGGAADR